MAGQKWRECSCTSGVCFYRTRWAGDTVAPATRPPYRKKRRTGQAAGEAWLSISEYGFNCPLSLPAPYLART